MGVGGEGGGDVRVGDGRGVTYQDSTRHYACTVSVVLVLEC